jgi:2-dehydro-3-deoxygluconokinase
VARGGSRLGIYFAETGASQRASAVVYDRAHSAISELAPGSLPWRDILAGAAWFHCTGITPALGAHAAACTKEALEAARAAGARVSVDLNFRRKLWSETQAQAVMRPLMPLVDVVIANEEDLQAVLGIAVPHTDVTAASLDLAGYREAAERVTREFGVRQVAVTLRESTSASDNAWSALLFEAAGGEFHHSRKYQVRLVDRIGGGDSFAAGLIHALLSGRDGRAALEFAVAASALKQTIPGDFNRVSVDEVERLAGGDASGRVQR